MHPDKIHLIEISSLKIEDRQRKELGDIESLKDSISTYGLLQPIVVNQDLRLIAGGRRTEAHLQLGLTHIKAIFRETLNEADLQELELEENIAREQLTWTENVLAIAKIHKFRKSHASQEGEVWGLRQTGQMFGKSHAHIHSALLVAEKLQTSPEIFKGCNSLNEAVKKLVSLREDAARKELASRMRKADASDVDRILNSALNSSDTDLGAKLSGKKNKIVGQVLRPSIITSTPNQSQVLSAIPDEFLLTTPSSTPTIHVPLSEILLCGDALELIKGVKNESVDCILTDWPYGIDMENLTQPSGAMTNIEAIESTHTRKGNIALWDAIVPEFFRVLKPNSYAFTWCDIDFWEYTKALFEAQGFRVQRWPIVWHKTHPCMNNMANKNFTKNFEIGILVAKGTPNLVETRPGCVWAGDSFSTKKRFADHPFVKPIELWQWLLTALTVETQLILDPFSGVGSSTHAALLSNRSFLAFEIEESLHQRQMASLANTYKQLYQDSVVFS